MTTEYSLKAPEEIRVEAYKIIQGCLNEGFCAINGCLKQLRAPSGTAFDTLGV